MFQPYVPPSQEKDRWGEYQSKVPLNNLEPNIARIMEDITWRHEMWIIFITIYLFTDERSEWAKYCFISTK